MPLYEYLCSRCGKRTEKIQSVHAEPLRECEFCGGPVERLISPPAIQFKGSGWYVTDYARKSVSPADGGKKASEPAKDSAAAKEPSTPAPAEGKKGEMKTE